MNHEHVFGKMLHDCQSVEAGLVELPVKPRFFGILTLVHIIIVIPKDLLGSETAAVYAKAMNFSLDPAFSSASQFL